MIRPMRASITTLLLVFTLFPCLILTSNSTSSLDESPTLIRRVDPYFPDYPPSCPLCAQNYPSINTCAQASIVLANFTMTLFNPGQFVNVIQCACTDTFQSTFPQCVDCFVQTNQSDVLNTSNLPTLLNNIRTACAIASTVVSNKTTSSLIPGATQTSGARAVQWHATTILGGIVLLLGTLSSCLWG